MIWDQLDKWSDTTEARFTTIVRHATTKTTILEAHIFRDLQNVITVIPSSIFSLITREVFPVYTLVLVCVIG